MGKINLKLLSMKAHYFFYNAGSAPISIFMSTYAKQLGFSSVVVGSIYTFLPISGMIAKPFFGALGDRFHIQKLIFLIFQIITAIASFSILYIPQIPVEPKINFECSSSPNFYTYVGDDSVDDLCAIKKALSYTNQSVISCQLNCQLPSVNSTNLNDIVVIITGNSINLVNNSLVQFPIEEIIFNNKTFSTCPNNGSFTTTCDASCNSSIINELLEIPVDDSSKTIQYYQFWMFVLFLTISWIGMAVVVSVGDAICFEILNDEPTKYGYQRLFGSFGWGITAIVAGFLVDHFSDNVLFKNYSPIFYIVLIMLFCDFCASSTLKYKQVKMSVNILKDVGKLVTEFRVLIFIGWCISVGFCTGIIWQFLFWYLEDLAAVKNCEMEKQIKTIEGLVSGVQSFFGEIPFFFLSDFILKRIGHIQSMNLVLLVFSIRLLLYSILTNPWLCLPIELLHGITFGLFYATMASYASIIAPSGTEATIQGFTGAVFEGVGASSGTFVGGLLYNNVGGALMFRYFGIGAFICFIIHALIQCIYHQCRPEDNNMLANDAEPVKWESYQSSSTEY